MAEPARVLTHIYLDLDEEHFKNTQQCGFFILDGWFCFHFLFLQILLLETNLTLCSSECMHLLLPYRSVIFIEY